jgi:hypothetical protein
VAGLWHDLPSNNATDRLIPENALKMHGYAKQAARVPAIPLFYQKKLSIKGVFCRSGV